MIRAIIDYAFYTLIEARSNKNHKFDAEHSKQA